MNVLERYILLRVLHQAASAFAMSMGIVWTIQALTKINLVTDSGQSIGAFLFLSLLLLPAVVPIVIPFAVLIATTNTLSSMNTDSELVVVHASGAPRSIVFRPILITSLLAAAIIIISGSLIEPYARQKARTLVAEARADLISLVIQEGSFKKIDENIYMQVAKRLPNGLLSGLFITDSRDANADLIYYAREGALVKQDDTSLLVMKDGEIHNRNVADGQLSIISFTSYAFDLSQFMSANGKPQLLPKDQTTAYLMAPDPNDRLFQSDPQIFIAELHKRLSEWAYAICFAMIGLAVCSMPRSHRENALFQTFSAVAWAFFMRWIGLLAEAYVEKKGGSIILIYLVPFAGMGVTGLIIYRAKILIGPKAIWIDFEKTADQISLGMRKSGQFLSRLVARRNGSV